MIELKFRDFDLSEKSLIEHLLDIKAGWRFFVKSRDVAFEKYFLAEELEKRLIGRKEHSDLFKYLYDNLPSKLNELCDQGFVWKKEYRRFGVFVDGRKTIDTPRTSFIGTTHLKKIYKNDKSFFRVYEANDGPWYSFNFKENSK